jgi:zeaxanthin epoxidase
MIFPAQFAYLYSYHPTGNIKETAAALEAKWREQHFKDSEAAFARVAVEGQKVTMPSFFQREKDLVLQAQKDDNME